MILRGRLSNSRPPAVRVAVLVHFLVQGTIIGLWASRLPGVKNGLQLVDGQLAVAFLVGSLAAMGSLRISGPLIEWFGSLRVTQIAGLVLSLSLLLPASAVGPLTLAAAIVAISVSASIQDVGMNSQAIAVEHRLNRPVMSSFHAAFSIGAIAGGGVGALAATAGISYQTTFVAASGVFTVAILIANRWLVDTAEGQDRTPENSQDAGRISRRAWLRLLGVICLVSFVAEGSAVDWAAIYLHDMTGATDGVAAIGFTAFNVAMALGRLVGDPLAARFDSLSLVRAGTALASAALGIGLLVGTTISGILGFVVAGLGLSIVVPQAFSAAGRFEPSRAPVALSVVSSIAYAGFFVGPALIGLLAHVADLRKALLAPALLLLTAAIAAGWLQRLWRLAPPHDSTPPAT